MPEPTTTEAAMEILKTVAPWVTGGLAGAILTLLYRARESRRRRKTLAIETIIAKYSLPDLPSHEGFATEDLSISYQNRQYYNLLLYTTEMRNTGSANVPSPVLVFKLPPRANVVKPVVTSDPINIPYQESRQRTQDSMEVTFSFERIEAGDRISVYLLLDCKEVDAIQCVPRNLDDVYYTIGEAAEASEIERNLYKLLVLLGLFIILGAAPIIGEALQGMTFIMMIPYIMRLFNYFRTRKKGIRNYVNIGPVTFREEGVVNVTNE